MAKQIVICPECGIRHTIEIEGLPAATVGVSRSRGKPFEFTLTAPQGMIEAGKFNKASEDMLLTAGLGIVGGGAVGWCAGLIDPVLIGPAAAIGSLGSITVAWWWLIDERYQRLRRMPALILAQIEEAKKSMPQQRNENEITLTVDTRNEYDGYTSKFFGRLPVEVSKFNEWAAAVMLGSSLAIKHWTGSKGLFSRDDYESLLAILRDARTVINQQGKGHLLTLGGRRALHQHLKLYHPPAPLLERA